MSLGPRPTTHSPIDTTILSGGLEFTLRTYRLCSVFVYTLHAVLILYDVAVALDGFQTACALGFPQRTLPRRTLGRVPHQNFYSACAPFHDPIISYNVIYLYLNENVLLMHYITCWTVQIGHGAHTLCAKLIIATHNVRKVPLFSRSDVSIWNDRHINQISSPPEILTLDSPSVEQVPNLSYHPIIQPLNSLSPNKMYSHAETNPLDPQKERNRMPLPSGVASAWTIPHSLTPQHPTLGNNAITTPHHHRHSRFDWRVWQGCQMSRNEGMMMREFPIFLWFQRSGIMGHAWEVLLDGWRESVEMRLDWSCRRCPATGIGPPNSHMIKKHNAHIPPPPPPPNIKRKRKTIH